MVGVHIVIYSMHIMSKEDKGFLGFQVCYYFLKFK